MFKRVVAQRIEEEKGKGLVLSRERERRVETYSKMKREEADKKLAERQKLIY
jgi:hypothetical protein